MVSLESLNVLNQKYFTCVSFVRNEQYMVASHWKICWFHHKKKKEIAAIKTRIQSNLLTQLFSSLKLPNPRPCNNMHWMNIVPRLDKLTTVNRNDGKIIHIQLLVTRPLASFLELYWRYIICSPCIRDIALSQSKIFCQFSPHTLPGKPAGHYA